MIERDQCQDDPDKAAADALAILGWAMIIGIALILGGLGTLLVFSMGE